MSAWYVNTVRDGATSGPFDAPTLAAMKRDGALTDADLFWDEAAQAWQPIASHPAWRSAVAPPSAAPAAAHGRADAAGSAGGSRLSAPFDLDEFAAVHAELAALADSSSCCSNHGEAPAHFCCEACGKLFCLTCLNYLHGTYFCETCRKEKKSKSKDLAAQGENSMENLLLRNAGAWAALLIVVPLVVFKFFTSLFDPYAGMPDYYPKMKQVIQILKINAKMDAEVSAHSANQALLAVARARSEELLAMWNVENERATPYALHLAVLERLGAYEEGLAFIKEKSPPPPQAPDRAEKMRLLELAFFARSKEIAQVTSRLEACFPKQQFDRDMMHMMPMMNAMNMSAMNQDNALMSGRKKYDIELEREVFEMISVDMAKVRAAAVESFGEAEVAKMCWSKEEALAAGNPYFGGFGAGDGAEDAYEARYNAMRAASIIEYSKASRDKVSAYAASNASVDRNRGKTREEAVTLLTNIVKTTLPGLTVEYSNAEERKFDRLTVHSVSMRFKIRDVEKLRALVTKLSDEAFPLHIEVQSVRFSSSRKDEWNVSTVLQMPVFDQGAGPAEMNALVASFAAVDTSAPDAAEKLQEAYHKIEKYVSSISYLPGRLNANRAALIEAAITGAKSSGLTEFSHERNSAYYEGEIGGQNQVNGMVALIARAAAPLGLKENVTTSETTRQGRKMIRWRAEYR